MHYPGRFYQNTDNRGIHSVKREEDQVQPIQPRIPLGVIDPSFSHLSEFIPTKEGKHLGIINPYYADLKRAP